MDVGMIGLGRMGTGLSRRLLAGGHRVVGTDRSPEAVAAIAAAGAEGAADLKELRARLEPPRTVWAMVPAGAPTEQTVAALGELLDPGDLVIDGGNSHFEDSRRHARELGARGIGFLDAGTSGGIWGEREGFCLMVGGDAEAFARAEPLFATLAEAGGYAHVGPSGAGHYVKMVHNGIEYALLQGYAEGFQIMEASDYDLDLHQVAEVWRHGSVVRSWLLDLAAGVYEQDPELSGVRGYVEDSGEGRWTVAEALAKDVPAPVINLSLIMRLRSREDDSYAGRVIAALRREFGGHRARGGP